jgi:uridine phosphorylase
VGFPHHPRKHAQPPLFTARELLQYLERAGEPRDRSPPQVILAFAPRVVDRVVARWGARPLRGLGRMFAVGRGRAAVGLAEVRGVGAPSMAVTVEELIAAGARRFVAVGFAGAVAPGLRIGATVLCTRALRDEGTSYHYARPSTWATPTASLTRQLADFLRRRGVAFRRGSSWTIDAPYRETRAELESVRRRRVLAVEMEASALFVVAHARGVEAAGLFTVSDLLTPDGWVPGFGAARADLERTYDLVRDGLRALPDAARSGRAATDRRGPGGRAGSGRGKVQ